MSKLNRVLWSGLVLVGAACGDDVTVAPPPPPPEPGVRAVTVAPDGATIAIGASLTFTAAVTTDPGAAAPTIAWSSSDVSIATVSAAGVATGVAVGSAGIRATATSGTSSASGVATLNVSNTSVTPATVSIQSIEQGGVPQNLTNLGGQVDVRVNLERGGESVQTVQLLVDGAVVSEQIFGSAAQASAPETAIEELVFSWNTAAFDAITGVPDHLNGPHAVSAKVITTQNESGTGSPNVNVVLNNSNTAILSIEISNGADATDADGLLWYTGDATARALPVIYTVASPTIAQVVFNPDGALLTKTDTEAPYSATWAKGTTFADGGSGGNGNPGVEDAFFNVCVTATVNGNPVNLDCLDDFDAEIRYDNNGPGAPTFMANPNGRQGGWLNGTVGLTGPNTSAADNDWLVDGAADGGVGGYERMLRTAVGPTIAGALAATASATPTLPDPSAANNTYCAVVSAADLLGNESVLPSPSTTPCTDPTPLATFTPVAAQHLRFGVDITAPSIAFITGTGLAANARVNTATVATEFSVNASDAGAIGVSGVAAATPTIGPVMATVKVFNALGTTCFIGTGSGCAPASIDLFALPGDEQVPPVISTETVAGSSLTGYYTLEARARDAAGNESDAITRSIAYDASTNPPALTSALFNVPLNGPTVAFTANSSDNFDLWDVTYTLSYPGLPGLGELAQPAVILNTFPPVPAALVNSNVPAGITISGFMRQAEVVGGNSPLAVGPAIKPASLNGTIRDQAGNATGPVATAIPAPAVTTGVSFTAALAGKLTDSWSITNAATNISNGAGPAAAVNPLSVTLNADAVGPNNTYDAPFARVDFYYLTGGGQLVKIASATASATTDPITTCPVGLCRRHRYSATWTPGAAQPVGAATIYAVGVSAAGDGLVSPANANITITNP